MVLAELIADFGKTGFYEADGFFDHSKAPWLHEQEGKTSSSSWQPAVDGAARARAVYASMTRADPDAIWVSTWILW